MSPTNLRATYLEILKSYAYGLRTIMRPGEHRLIPGVPRLYAEKKVLGQGVEVFNRHRYHGIIIGSYRDGSGKPYCPITERDPFAGIPTREILTSTILLARIVGTHDYYAAIELGSPEFETELIIEGLS